MKEKIKNNPILLVYATNSGSTFVAGRTIRDILSKEFDITMKKAADVSVDDFKKSKTIILGSPSWSFGQKEGFPHESIIILLNKLKDADLSQKHFAIFGCGDSSYTFFCGAVDYLEKFVDEKNGKTLIDSLRLDGFLFDLKKNTSIVNDWSKLLTKKLKKINK